MKMTVHKLPVVFLIISGILLNIHTIFGQVHDSGNSLSPVSEVKMHNGTPAVFLEGEPDFYGVWWCSAPKENGWRNRGFAEQHAEKTGIHLYAFDVGRTEWCGPGEGKGLYELPYWRFQPSGTYVLYR